jgi:hypothetical protein
MREHRTVSLLSRLAELQVLPLAEIRKTWTDMFGVSPPAVGRELLALGIAYQLQEDRHGELPARERRQLDRSAATLRRSGKFSYRAPRSLPVGTLLVREWHGKTYHVRVTNDGFSCNGKVYRSLTHLAREISGCSWPGPAFFGLRSRKSKSPSTAPHD